MAFGRNQSKINLINQLSGSYSDIQSLSAEEIRRFVNHSPEYFDRKTRTFSIKHSERKNANFDFLIGNVFDNQPDLHSSFRSKVIEECFFRNSKTEEQSFTDSDNLNQFNNLFTTIRGFLTLYKPVSESSLTLFNLSVNEIFNVAERLDIDKNRLSLQIYLEACYSPQRDFFTPYVRSFVDPDFFVYTNNSTHIGANSFFFDNPLYIAANFYDIEGFRQYQNLNFVNKDSLKWKFDFIKREFSSMFSEDTIDTNQLVSLDACAILAFSTETRHKKLQRESVNAFRQVLIESGFDFTEEKESIILLNSLKHTYDNCSAFTDFNWNVCQHEPLIALIESGHYTSNLASGTESKLMDLLRDKKQDISLYFDKISQEKYNDHLVNFITNNLIHEHLISDDLRKLIQEDLEVKTDNSRNIVKDFKTGLDLIFHKITSPLSLFKDVSPEKWDVFYPEFQASFKGQFDEKIESLSNSISKRHSGNSDKNSFIEKRLLDLSLHYNMKIEHVFLHGSIPSFEPGKLSRI